MATIEARPNEKDGSIGSSDGRPTGRVYDLDARRRAALSQADNASFSSVLLLLLPPSLLLTLSSPAGSI